MIRMSWVTIGLCTALLSRPSQASDELSVLRAACEKGDVKRCYELSAKLPPAEWDAWFSSTGVTLFEAACVERGDGCREVMNHFNDGKNAPRDVERVLRSGSRGCVSGDDEGCVLIRKLIWHEPIPWDEATAEERCADGAADGCYALARVAVGRKAATGGEALVAVGESLSTRCDGGNVAACFVAAQIYAPMSQLPIANASKAESLMRKACNDYKQPHVYGACDAADRLRASIASERVTTLKADCDRGTFQACAEAAALLDAQYGKDGAAAELAERGCVGGVATSCFIAGRAYLFSPHGYFNPDHTKAEKYLETACAAKMAPACAMLGKVLAPRDSRVAQLKWPSCGVEDAAKSAAAFERGCDAGDGESCAEFGARSYAGVGIAADKTRAYSSFQKACELHNADGCIGVATATLTGEGTAKDLTTGVKLLDSACDSDGRACALLGSLLAQGGGGVTADPARAVTILVKGCGKSAQDACNVLGTLHFLGMGTPKDEVKGIEILEKACMAGSHAKSCVDLAQLFQAPRPGMSDEARVVKLKTYLQYACRAGYMPACR